MSTPLPKTPRILAPHEHAPGGDPCAGHAHLDGRPHPHPPPADVPKAIESRHWLDRFGFTVSFLCALHCAAMPIVLGAFPSLGSSLFGDPRVEWFLFGAVVAIGVGSLLPSFLRRHRDARPLMLFVVGASVLLASKLAADEGSSVEAVMSATAALLVSGGHLLNVRLVRTCTVLCHEAHDHIH